MEFVERKYIMESPEGLAWIAKRKRRAKAEKLASLLLTPAAALLAFSASYGETFCDVLSPSGRHQRTDA